VKSPIYTSPPTKRFLALRTYLALIKVVGILVFIFGLFALLMVLFQSHSSWETASGFIIFILGAIVAFLLFVFAESIEIFCAIESNTGETNRILLNYIRSLKTQEKI
jgi:hypothetical protein